ncbi:protein FAR1-RELATED SEQUENCE 9-like [Rhododendron vialii]|uniref:protein FAR1-RELATED SEQUENCE 9-like n=1 Tax=Rhododendron vialii TaxID=182163 RepID=UPI00265FF4A5|nr:protein FAR1-RELATED SEQUENCE 9-like [Rhododendron vialii]
MKENELESNKWLQGLFDIRESWVPVYNRGTFFAGMNTTVRSEGINSFFDGFVTHTSNLKEFVVKYEKALNRIVKRENDEDFESEHKFRIVNDHEFLLKHAGKVYTRNVFNKFKESWSKVFDYKVENVRNGNSFQSFEMKSKYDELEKFEVTLDSQTYEGKCECQQFEFVGILCAHILKVFVRLDIDEIPEHFILPRWRQKANKFRIIDSQGLVHDDGKEESEALRLSHMCQEATKLACLAAPSNGAYTIFIEGMNDLFEKIQKVSKVSPIEICADKDNEKSIEPSRAEILLLDPNISQCKGRKKDVKGKAATTQSTWKRKWKVQIVTKRKAQIALNDLRVFWHVSFVSFWDEMECKKVILMDQFQCAEKLSFRSAEIEYLECRCPYRVRSQRSAEIDYLECAGKLSFRSAEIDYLECRCPCRVRSQS